MKLNVIAAIATISVSMLTANMSFADSHKASGADSLPASSKTIVMKQRLEVININHEKRWVELKDRSGFSQKINVGESARNFNQLAVGDIIDVNRSKTIKMKAFGADVIDAGAEAVAIFARTPEGQKPGVAMAGGGVVVVTIAAIDLENSLVTLEDADGNLDVLQPEITANLKKVKVGDKVAIMVVKTFSIAVNKAK